MESIKQMISKTIRGAYLLLALFLISSSLCLAQEEFLPYPGIIHIHSNVSEGVYPLRKLVSLAQDKGIKILVFSDSYLRRWEYGSPVFSNIFKVSIEENSVVKYGIKNYLEDFKKIKDEFPDMLILEGLEVSPFYWWSGSPFRKNLITLNDWNKHLVVVGLKRYQDYTHLPLVGNRNFAPQLKDTPLFLIPLFLIISGALLLRKRSQRKFLGLISTAAGILFLFSIYPFSASKYNPYYGSKGYLPYQDLINYVNKKEGLVFWAHPEITELASTGRFATINFYTPSYPEALILTSGYRGFGVNMLPGTSHNLILAGGEWDNVLRSYCEGKRNQPVWVIAEADYRGPGKIDPAQNIFFLSKFKPESIFEALRKGRLYIRYYSENNINISLADFHIEDSKMQIRDASAFIAEEIKIAGKPRLRIKGTYIINPAEDLTIEIIRYGEIIKKFEFTPLEKAYTIRENSLTGLTNEKVFDLEFQDDSLQPLQRKSYYRLNFFVGNNIILVTNPIFVKLKNGQ